MSSGTPLAPLVADNEDVYRAIFAHAHVYFLGYSTFNQNQRKKKARKLAELCREVTI